MKRLWGVRHVRWLWLSCCFALWWDRVGRHLGAFPNPGDLDFLDKVWSGEA